MKIIFCNYRIIKDLFCKSLSITLYAINNYIYMYAMNLLTIFYLVFLRFWVYLCVDFRDFQGFHSSNIFQL